MAFEWWWLLVIPLLFGLGWLAGGLDKRQSQREQAELPRSYFRALNHLLNNQPDLAADAFIEVVKLNPEMVELHLALGNLFRQRGEPDRAIRIHQNLLARADLSSVQRQHATYELGLDFMKAGLFDRAESTLLDLQESSYDAPAKRALMQIYQSTRDYARALAIGLNVGTENTLGKPDTHAATSAESAHSWQLRLAHLACELLEQTWDKTPAAERAPQIQQALQLAPQAARPWILQARQMAAQGEWHAVLPCWQQVVERAPQHLTLFAAEWQHWQTLPGFQDAGLQREFATQLAGWYAEHNYVELLDLLLANAVLAAQAPQLLAQALQRKPSAAHVLRMLEGKAMPLAAQSNLQAILQTCIEALKKEAQRQPRYVCTHCGFKSAHHSWQCPGCQQWDSLSPAQ